MEDFEGEGATQHRLGRLKHLDEALVVLERDLVGLNAFAPLVCVPFLRLQGGIALATPHISSPGVLSKHFYDSLALAWHSDATPLALRYAPHVMHTSLSRVGMTGKSFCPARLDPHR